MKLVAPRVFEVTPQTSIEILPSEGSETALIAAHGRLDTSSAPFLGMILNHLTEDDQCTNTVLNLSNVSLIDTEGLRALVSSRYRNKEVDKELTLQDPSRQVISAVRLIGLSKLFGMEEL